MMKAATEELEKILLSLRGGAIDPFQEESKGNGGLYGVLKKAQDQGVPVLDGIEELWQQVLAAKTELSQRKRLKTLIYLRALGTLAVICCVRGGLLWSGKSLDFAGFWGSDFQGALLLGFWGLSVLTIAMPRHWLWRQSWTPLGLQWLESYLGFGDGPPPQNGVKTPDWFQPLQDCALKEITWGVSLTKEKHRILRDFASQQRSAFLGRLTLIEEVLPLWELLVLGSLIVLGLALPSINWLLSG